MKLSHLIVSLAFLAAAVTAKADTIRWIGWSPDETKYAYLLRQPYGETGYTDEYLVIRDSASGGLHGNYHVRDARYFIDHPPKYDETQEYIEEREQIYVDELLRKGYLLGKELSFRSPSSQLKLVNGERIPFITALVTVNTTPIYFSTSFTNTTALLHARTAKGRSPGVSVARTPILPLPFMTGTPDARMYRVPPTHPSGFYLSSKKKWVSSMWIGRATLPDGLSWPAYAFVAPFRSLPR